MSSRFDHFYDRYAVPLLMRFVGEEDDPTTPKNVVYIGRDGVEVELTAIVTNQEYVEEYDDEGGRRIRRREVCISTDASSEFGGVTSPQLRAEVRIDGETWAVESVESHSRNMVRLRLVRDAVMERTKAGYRKGV